MTAPFTWGSVGSVMNLLTTELNALANGTLSALGPEINNTGGVQQGQFHLHLASAAFVAPSFVAVYFVPSNDTAGTTYPVITSAAAWAAANYFAGMIQINGSTAVQNEMAFATRVPLGKFKTCLLTGGSTPTLAGTLNTLDLYPEPNQY